MVYVVGTNRTDPDCGGGLWMLDVKDPKNPKSLGCEGSDGYTHDGKY